MNKQQFLNALYNSLQDFSVQERNEIMYDYEEHFAIGLEGGKTEEEICWELGNPESIAEQYRTNSKREREPQSSQPFTISRVMYVIFRAIIVSIGLLIGNAFALVPFLTVGSILLAFAIVSFAFVVGGVAAIFLTILKPILSTVIPYFEFSSGIAVLFYGAGLVSLGIVFYLVVGSLGKVFFKATGKYLKMNLNIILGRR